MINVPDDRSCICKKNHVYSYFDILGLAMRSLVRYAALFFSAVLFSGLTACATYSPRPLDEHAVSKGLSAPDAALIRVKAREIKHPILKPRNIDLSKGMSAEDAAIIAVIANPALRAERDSRGIAEAQLLQAGILPNPSFSYGMDFPTGGNTQDTTNAYGLGLDWSIKALLSRSARVAAARAGESSVDLDIAWKEWQVSESAKLRVYRIVLLERQLEVAKREEGDLRKDLEAIRKAVDAGDMTIIDLDAVDATLRRTHATVLALEQKLQQEKLELNRLLGFPSSSRLRLKKGITFPRLGNLPSVANIVRGIEKRRLDLLALKEGYQSQEARLRAAVREQFPNIDIGLSHASDTSHVITTGFSVSISLPFFDRNQGQIAIEKATRQQLYDEYMNRVFQARADAAGILADVRATEKQIDAADRAVKTLRKLVRVSYNGFLEGNIDALTYYNEVDRLTSRRLDTLKLRQKLADLYVALEITAGEYLGNGSQ